MLSDDESVSMATENKIKDGESTATSVATESTTEGSKVSQEIPQILLANYSF